MEIDSGAAAAANANTANKLDLPLDQLITANRQAKRRQRKPTGGAKPQQQQQRSGPYQRRASGGIQSASRQNAPKATSVPDVGSKIIVSNLHFNVTESDLRELFSTMGALKKVSLSFDATGKSKGVAEVVFVRRPDAISAVRKYNNVQLDGRPMKMEMTTSAVSVLDRIAPAAGASNVASNTAGRLGAKQQSRQNQQRNRRRIRGGAGRPQAKTADQLDADMDSYMEAAQ